MPRILINKSPLIKNIGNRIAQIRKSRGLTQKELALKIGISRDLLASYELDRIRIYGDMIAQIAIALKVSADDILNIKNRSKPNIQEFYDLDVRWIKKISEIKKLSQEDQRKVNVYINDLLKKTKSID